MAIFSKMLSVVRQIPFPQETFKHWGTSIYTGMIVISFGYGAACGFHDWCNYMDKRQRRCITIKTLEPIVNNVCDAGLLAWHVGLSGGISAFVAATFPISVPILLWGFQEPPNPNNKDDKYKNN